VPTRLTAGELHKVCVIILTSLNSRMAPLGRLASASYISNVGVIILRSLNSRIPKDGETSSKREDPSCEGLNY
jgi:hypothetical protein